MSLTQLPRFDASDFEATARIAAEILKQTGQQLVAIDAERRGVLEPVAVSRPLAKTVNLPLDGTETQRLLDAERQGAKRGLSVVGWNPTTREVTFARLLPTVVAIRETVAKTLSSAKQIAPHQIEVAVTWHVEARIDRIEIRTREVALDSEKALAVWKQVALRLPGGSNGWKVEQQLGSSVTLIWGAPRSLPPSVDGRELLPAAAAEAWECDWRTLDLGADATGQRVSLDFNAGPHASVIGGTGSGKTVAARLILVQAILHGFETIAVDPTKRLGGLLGMREYTKGMYISSIEEAAAVVGAVYEEVFRRVDLISEVGGEDWLDLPEGTVRPWLLLIDEWASLIEEDRKPPASMKGTPEMAEWESESLAKGQLMTRVGKLAREARSAGIHVVLLSQIASVEVIPTKIRANLGTSVQLKGKKAVRSTDLEMVFPGQSAEAMLELIELADGGKGLGLAQVDGDVVTGFRVGFLDKDDIEQLLEERGARRPEPLVINAPSAASAAPSAPPAWR